MLGRSTSVKVKISAVISSAAAPRWIQDVLLSVERKVM
jgi:hypothetical protein